MTTLHEILREKLDTPVYRIDIDASVLEAVQRMNEYSIGALIVFRLLSYVPLPGIDPPAWEQIFNTQSGGILGMGDEARADVPPGLERHPLQRRGEGEADEAAANHDHGVFRVLRTPKPLPVSCRGSAK